MKTNQIHKDLRKSWKSLKVYIGAAFHGDWPPMPRDHLNPCKPREIYEIPCKSSQVESSGGLKSHAASPWARHLHIRSPNHRVLERSMAEEVANKLRWLNWNRRWNHFYSWTSHVCHGHGGGGGWESLHHTHTPIPTPSSWLTLTPPPQPHWIIHRYPLNFPSFFHICMAYRS